VGQDEVEIVRMADTTVIVTVPGLGDDIQAIKAGILEAGDIFVVNKMDRGGVGRTVQELRNMLALSGDHERRAGWEPPVLTTSALDGRGVAELMEALDGHQRVLDADGGKRLDQRRREGLRRELLDLIQSGIMERLVERLEKGRGMEPLVARVLNGGEDPYTVSDEIIKNALGGWPSGQGE
jgi:LAO/AO transport system kinase